MGNIEKESLKKRRPGEIQRLILCAVATTGILSVALVAPNVLGAMMKLGIVQKKRSKESVYAARKRLVKNGLLNERNGQITLTKKGERVLSMYHIPLPGKRVRWDKRWRVLIFDIPEKKRGYRARVREALRLYGFIKLQQSVWAYPYPCEEFVTLLKTEFKLNRELIYMIVENIENDIAIRKHFSLKT
ncbi:MAG: CRISPR-associated endonuclease Cas2 [Patescibacteria group bacterium]